MLTRWRATIWLVLALVMAACSGDPGPEIVETTPTSQPPPLELGLEPPPQTEEDVADNLSTLPPDSLQKENLKTGDAEFPWIHPANALIGAVPELLVDDDPFVEVWFEGPAGWDHSQPFPERRLSSFCELLRVFDGSPDPILGDSVHLRSASVGFDLATDERLVVFHQTYDVGVQSPLVAEAWDALAESCVLGLEPDPIPEAISLTEVSTGELADSFPNRLYEVRYETTPNEAGWITLITRNNIVSVVTLYETKPGVLDEGALGELALVADQVRAQLVVAERMGDDPITR